MALSRDPAHWVRVVVDLVFPVNCVLCQRPAYALCPDCFTALGAHPHVSNYGGVPLAQAVADHKALLRVLVRLKDHNQGELARPLGRLLIVALDMLSLDQLQDVVVLYAPGASSSWGNRGFVPVKKMLRSVGVPMVNGFERVRRIHDQRNMTVLERERNIHGSLCADPDLRGVRVLLVDDVITTGATVRECVRALEEVGALIVGIACLTSVPKKIPRFDSNP